MPSTSTTPRRPWRRGRVALARANRIFRRRTSGRVGRARLFSGLVCLAAGLMITVSSINARGTDLRPSRNTDLVGLVQQQARHNTDLRTQLARERQEVDELGRARGGDLPAASDATLRASGQRAVSGPAVTVVLTDAPLDVAPPDVDGDLLVVHQQDIQAVVNALWSGGAEAMTIQGQRVVSTTGIKCVGNTVVLHGIPYAPPYRITAIGDQGRLQAALAGSSYLQIYQQYVQAYGLGYTETKQDDVTLPAYRGSTKLQYARPLR